MTISAHNQWAWGGPKDGVKPLAACLLMLIRCAGGDGNMLLNVGPEPTGAIEDCQVERLKEIGAWLAKYGESIYATRGGPYKPAKHVVSTRKGNTVYLHVLAWPEEVLKLPALPAKIVKSSLLTGGQAQVSQTDAGIEITVPKSDRQEIDTIVVLRARQAGDRHRADRRLQPGPIADRGQEGHGIERLSERGGSTAAKMAVDDDDDDALGHRRRHQAMLAGGGPRQAGNVRPRHDRRMRGLTACA